MISLDTVWYFIIIATHIMLGTLFLFKKDNGLRGMIVIYFYTVAATATASLFLFEAKVDSETLRLARLIPLSVVSTVFVIYYFYYKYFKKHN